MTMPTDNNARLVERLRKIAELAAKQRQFPFTVESDAAMALELIKDLAMALLEQQRGPDAK